MPHCHECAKELRTKGTMKVMKTGAYSGGGNFYRTVNLCPDCAEAIDRKEAAAKKSKVLGMVAVVLVVIGVYVSFMR